MERLFSYNITKAQQDMTIAQLLRNIGYSRHLLTELKRDAQGILLNRAPAFTNARLSLGDLLQIRLLEPASSPNIIPAPMKLNILWEDEDLLVLDKPADTPIHPSQNNHCNTLANGVAWYYQQQGIPFVYRCVNRLDRDTTGALILAKHGLSAAILSKMMQERKIHRTYLAVVQGIPPASGIIDAPIGRKEGSVVERTIDWEKGEPAVTHYERLAVRQGRSLIQLTLDTGRTHQIRIHMQSIGCPLLGDYLYHPEYSRISRVSLHSYQLEFPHPITGEPLLFTSPVPSDLADAF